ATTQISPLSLHDALPISADAATAVDLRNACSIRSRDACDALANRCDGGDKPSCVELGNVYRLGLGNDMDFAKARELFARWLVTADRKSTRLNSSHVAISY